MSKRTFYFFMAKNPVYKWIRFGGYLTFIPLVLVGGPLTGFIVGQFLKEKFSAPDHIFYLFIVLGLIGGIFEVVQIIRRLISEEKKD